MDLFTRCTRCGTVFRVTTVDLQASSGQVRCGRCQAVFDAFASLTARPPGQAELDATARLDGPARSDKAETDAPTTVPGELALLDTASSESVPDESELNESARSESALPESVPDESASQDRMPNEPVPHEPASEEPVPEASALHKEMPDPKSVPESASEPQIAAVGARTRAAVGPPRAVDRLADDPATNLYEWEFKAAPKLPRIRLWLSMSLLLGVIAIAQSAYVFRTHLMVNYPQLRPLYEHACQLISCEIGLPRLADQLDIDASDLQVIDPQKRNQVELTALIRNRARVAVEYPALELTLTNEKEQVVARRVFLAEEYLSDERGPDQGFAGRGELAVRLFLDIGPLRAAGYRIYLFYPA